MRVYIESTIPSYVVARPARDLLQAARQQVTRDWWELRRDEARTLHFAGRCGRGRRGRSGGGATRRLVDAAGLVLPEICTPDELMETDDDDNQDI